MESCLVEVPVVLGHFRPVILMPLGLLAGLPAEQIEAILLHELAHIRRCDYLVNLLQRSIEGILFYHPAVWWISGMIRAERENCCDDVAVTMSGNAGEYAAALAALEVKRGTIVQPAVAATGGNLMKRIRRLLYPEQPAGLPAPLFATVIFLATAAVALAAWQSDSPAPQQEAAATSDSPYRHWLNEDVAYIIRDDERAAFKSLTTDEEREKFIEQFWLRRDPTPGTEQNEAKEEHYRRIEYANEHFASRLPGWKTDRGRIYITYGPPDEKESHPAGGNGKPPFEDWLYHHIEGIGNNIIVEFVDPKGDGEFRQTVDPNSVGLVGPPRR
jgi:GWxTD domain-containing protein